MAGQLGGTDGTSGIAALLVATVSLWLSSWTGSAPAALARSQSGDGALDGFAGLALLVGPAHLGGSERVRSTALRSWLWPPWRGLVARVFQTWGNAQFGDTGGRDAESDRGSDSPDRRLLLEIRPPASGAISMRSWLALGYYRFRVGHRFSA